MLAVGSLVAALFGTQLFETEKFTQIIKLMFSGTFILLTLLGISTVMQLAKLRAAWYEAMLAMNQLKEFAIQQNPELAGAFRWQNDSLPPKHKRNSISYYQASEVALIGGMMFGAAAFFFQQAFFQVTILTWMLSGSLGFALIFLQLSIYSRLTK
jgi:hypothetical protein